MSGARKLSMLAGTASVALAVPMLLSGTPAAAGGDGPAPAPENLHLVMNEHDQVDRLEWDPPSGVSEPGRYNINYRFASDGALGEQVFWWTSDTFLEASGTFGHFVECTPQHRPSEEWVVWITYATSAGESERSNQVSMCLP